MKKNIPKKISEINSCGDPLRGFSILAFWHFDINQGIKKYMGHQNTSFHACTDKVSATTNYDLTRSIFFQKTLFIILLQSSSYSGFYNEIFKNFLWAAEWIKKPVLSCTITLCIWKLLHMEFCKKKYSLFDEPIFYNNKTDQWTTSTSNRKW